MKIRTQKDVEKLDQKIKTELGIDVSKYRNQEIVENFADLIVFPQYAISWIIRPVLGAILLFILGFFVIDLVHIEYLLYSLLGFVLFLISGFIFGLLVLAWKIKKDIWGIVEYTLDIMKSAVVDLNQTNKQMTPGNKKETLGLLFLGILHVVTIPMLSEVIGNKLPLVGRPVGWFIKKVLTLIAGRISFDEEIKEEMLKSGEAPNAVQVYTKSIMNVSNGLKIVMDWSFAAAQFPLKLAFGIVASLLLLFLYLI